MKKLLIILSLAAFIPVAFAQQKNDKLDAKVNTKTTSKCEAKNQKGTTACKDSTKAHDEKGHVCSDACKGIKK